MLYDGDAFQKAASPPRKRPWGRGICVLALLLLILFTVLLRDKEPEDPPGLSEEAMPPVSTAEVGPNRPTISDTLRSGETLYLSLRQHGLSDAGVVRFVQTLGKAFDLRRCHPGDVYTAFFDSSGAMRRFEYIPDQERIFIVEKRSGGLTVRQEKAELDEGTRGVTGTIASSLYGVLVGTLGERPELAMMFADIFGWQMDFLVDPREGDQFTLIFEEQRKGDAVIRYNRILAAEYRAQRRTLVGIFYEDPAGHRDHYDLEGDSLRRMFLKSPLNYRRISSRFTHKRFHPVLKRYLPHLGVDYAAPTGTPVQATADGTIIHKGWKGPNGHLVMIQHGRSYITTYGHLSKYARGIKKGGHVRQGQVIGYVGSTGRSTGPHLDYRVKKSGRYVDPLKESNVPSGKPVRDEYLPEFHKVRDEMLQRIEERRVEMQETQVAEAPREEPADSTAHMEPLDREKRGVFSRLFDLLF